MSAHRHRPILTVILRSLHPLFSPLCLLLALDALLLDDILYLVQAVVLYLPLLNTWLFLPQLSLFLLSSRSCNNQNVQGCT
ncbi:unnamed protein product [Urochloa humidicola]